VTVPGAGRRLVSAGAGRYLLLRDFVLPLVLVEARSFFQLLLLLFLFAISIDSFLYPCRWSQHR
jgi:hypothetical protein